MTKPAFCMLPHGIQQALEYCQAFHNIRAVAHSGQITTLLLWTLVLAFQKHLCTHDRVLLWSDTCSGLFSSDDIAWLHCCVLPKYVC